MVVVFACMITVAAVLFAGAKSSTGRSMTDASLQLAGRSVLSEYDKRLLSDYGLLAFRGDEWDIEDAIIYYAEASLAPKDPLYVLFRGGNTVTISQNTRVAGLTVSLKEFSLYDLDIFESQIKEAVLTKGVESFFKGYKKGSGSAEGGTEKSDGYGRVLRNKSVISTLPSEGYQGPVFPSFGDISDIPKLENVFNEATSMFLVSEYALCLFGNHVDGSKEDHFFGNEVEYLIAGKYDDDANYRNMKHRLRAIRFILNNVALKKDTKRMAEVEELAIAIAAVTGESAYEAVKVAVFEAWVAAETGNDLMLLEQGDKVAFLKTDKQWATDNIVEIWAGWTGSEPTHPTDRGGQTYKDYLRLMLYVLDRETKLLRMMDLMQINLKGTYYGDFLMREHYTGFRFACTVDGELYAYTEKY